MNNKTATYQELFNTYSYYTVNPDRAIISAGAYFKELMDLVNHYITLDQDAIPLETRRPDLWKKELNPHNTETLVYKINIVNEVLKDFLGVGENLIGKYPFNLPYNQPLVEIQHYLKKNDTSLPHIWKSLLKDDFTEIQKYRYHISSLTLSQEQWSLYSTPINAEDLREYYGLPQSETPVTDTLSDIQTFMGKSGLNFEKLQELLYEDLSDKEIDNNININFFINAGAPKQEALSIVGQQMENLSDFRLDRANRFIRLAQAIGLSFTDLDWTLHTIANKEGLSEPLIDDSSLPYLAWICTTAKERELTINQVCASIGAIKDFGKKNGDSFFEQIFKATIENSPLSKSDQNKFYQYELTWNVPLSGQNAKTNLDQKIQNVLAASYQISQDDLLAIANLLLSTIDLLGTRILTLNATNLGILYRLSILPKLTGSTIPNSLISASLIPRTALPLPEFLFHNIDPTHGLLTILNPEVDGQTLAKGEIVSTTLKSTDAYTFVVKDNKSTDDISVDIILLNGEVVSVAIDGQTNNSLTGANGNKYIQLEPRNETLLASPVAEYVIQTLNAIQDFNHWLKGAPLSLYQLQFILTGSSSDKKYQNNILGIDAIINFINGLNAAIQKSLMGKKTFLSLNRNALESLIAAILSPGVDGSALLPIIIADPLAPIPTPSEFALSISNEIYSALEQKKISCSIGTNGVIEFTKDKKSKDLNILKKIIIQTLGQIFAGIDQNIDKLDSKIEAYGNSILDSLHKSYTAQQKTLNAHIASLYKIDNLSGAALVAWGNLNLYSFIDTKTQVAPVNILDCCVIPNFHTLLSVDYEQESFVNQVQKIILNIIEEIEETLENLQLKNTILVLQKLQQGAVLIKGLSLSPAEASFFKTDFHPTSTYPISLHAVKTQSSYKRLAKEYQDTQNILLNLLDPKSSMTLKSKEKVLSKLTGWNKEQLSYLFKKLKYTKDLNIAEIELADSYFTYADKLSVNVIDICRIVDLSFEKIKESNFDDISRALWGGLRAQYSSKTDSLTALKNRISEGLRDRLVDLALYKLNLQYPRDLYEYFLIDVEVSGLVQTSIIKECISALQLYIYRSINKLENGVAVQADLTQIWTWMNTFRVWQANKEVFVYPEDYILPDLRKNQTDLFADLQNALRQANLTDPSSVEAAFMSYMNEYAVIGDIEIDGQVIVDSSDGDTMVRTLGMVGRARLSQPTYYFRLATFTRANKGEPWVAADWGQWAKINIQIQPAMYTDGTSTAIGKVTPAFVFGNWNLYWVELVQSGGTGSGSGSTKNYTFNLQYSSLNFNDSWTPAQTLVSQSIQNVPSSTDTPLTSGETSVTVSSYLHLNPSVTNNTYCLNVEYCNKVYYLSTQGSGLLYSTDGENFINVNPANAADSIQTNAIITSVVQLSNGFIYATASSKVKVTTYAYGMVARGNQAVCEAIPMVTENDSFGVYYSTNGTSFQSVQGLPATNEILAVYELASRFYALSTQQVVYSSNDGIKFANPKAVMAGQACFTEAFVVNDIAYLVGDNQAVLYTTDGETYSPINGVPAQVSGIVVQSINNITYLGTKDSGFYYSLDGINFESATSAPITSFISGFSLVNQTVYALSTNGGLYYSTNGKYFQKVNLTPANASSTSVSQFKDQIYIVYSGAIYASPDGENFTLLVPAQNNTPYFEVFSTMGLLFATSLNGLQYSHDGTNFLMVNTNYTGQLAIAAADFCNNKWFVSTAFGLCNLEYVVNYSYPNNYPAPPKSTTPPATTPPAILATKNISGSIPPVAPGVTISTPTLDYLEGNVSVCFDAGKTTEVHFRLMNPTTDYLENLLHQSNGIDALLDPAAQANLSAMDFTQASAVSVYYWEIFFHAPFLIAYELQTALQFSAAKSWYEYIFNPSSQSDPSITNQGAPTDIYWLFAGLKSSVNPLLAQELNESVSNELRYDLENAAQLYIYDTDPFDPQAIANLRPIAYQKAIVMNYINNIIAWGDNCYRENTRESIIEAEMFYVMAYDLLGSEPINLGSAPLSPPAGYETITKNGGYWLSFSQYLSDQYTVLCATDCVSGIFAGTEGNGLWYSADQGVTWYRPESGVSENYSITAIAEYNETIFAAAGNKGIFISTDQGKTFAPSNSGFPSPPEVTAFQSIGVSVYAASNAGLWRSDDNGKFWYLVAIKSDAPGLDIDIMENINNVLVLGTDNAGLWLYNPLTNSQTIPTENGFPATASVTAISNQLGALWVGTASQGLWRSYDFGKTWNQITDNEFPTDTEIQFIGSAGDIIVVSTNDQFWTSLDGLEWTKPADTGLPPKVQATCLQTVEGISYMGTYYHGLWYSDDGLTWTQVVGEAGLPADARIMSINYIDGNIFTATENKGFYKKPPYFGIERNQQFLDYWSTIKQRLFNIRHSLTIDGQPDALPLFQPPIDPMALVEAVASGESVAQAVQNLSSAIPYYRFSTMIEKAKAMTQTVISLGQSLLSALEKQDAEELAILYVNNNNNILQMTQASKQAALSAATQNIAALQAGLQSAQDRQSYYKGLISEGFSPGEIAEITLSATSLAAQAIVAAIKAASIVGYSAPVIYGMSDGGMKLGDAIGQGAAIAESVGSILSQSSQMAGTIAGYLRRADDWGLQSTLAGHDINQIQQQIVAAQYQQNIAQQEITLLQKNIDQGQNVAQFYQNKFTNTELYQWYIGQVSALYFQTYQLAYDTALQAQNAWNFEYMGERLVAGATGNFVNPRNWNSLYQGLLAGDSLMLDLQTMEKAFYDQNQRRLEIVKTVSLSQLDPGALNSLKTGGSCSFQITELDYAYDFPNHYCRQIKSVAVTIPAILGPYQNLHATLTQTASYIISSDDSAGEEALAYLLQVNKQPSTAIKSNLVPNQQVAISQGVNDSGMFELNFNDPRYLPFEGTGAVSNWDLSLPLTQNSIDFNNITDVIFTIRYTALPASSSYAHKASGYLNSIPYSGYSLYSLSQQFASAWYGFTQEGQNLTFDVNPLNWRRNMKLKIGAVTIYPVGDISNTLSLTLHIPLTKGTTKYTFTGWEKNGGVKVDVNQDIDPLLGQWYFDKTAKDGVANLTNLIIAVEFLASPA